MKVAEPQIGDARPANNRSEDDMNGVVIALVVVLLTIARIATAAPVFGIFGNEDANVGLALGTPLDSRDPHSFNQGTVVAVPDYTFPSLAAATSTAGNLSGFGQTPVLVSLTGRADVQGSADDGRLHAAVDASAPNTVVCGNGPGSYCTTTSSASAHFYENWEDGLTFAGAAPNSTVVFEVTQHFAGSIGSGLPLPSGLDAFDQLSLRGETDVLSCDICLGLGFDNVFNVTTPGTFDFSRSIVVSTVASNAVQLEEQLLLDASAGTGGPTSSFVNALDTGLVTIRILTPGVTLSTLSGATYTSSAVPVSEPGSLMLVLLGLGAAVERVRRRRR
jgi:hypothetical protein